MLMPSSPLLSTLLVGQTEITLGAIIAVLVLLNTLGIFGLIWHAGSYVGSNDQWKKQAESRWSTYDGLEQTIRSMEKLQVKMDLVVTSLQTSVNTSQTEMQMLRKRMHDLTGLIHRTVLEKSISIERHERLEEEEG